MMKRLFVLAVLAGSGPAWACPPPEGWVSVVAGGVSRVVYVPIGSTFGEVRLYTPGCVLLGAQNPSVAPINPHPTLDAHTIRTTYHAWPGVPPVQVRSPNVVHIQWFPAAPPPPADGLSEAQLWESVTGIGLAMVGLLGFSQGRGAL
jgi:hypothetical protein